MVVDLDLLNEQEKIDILEKYNRYKDHVQNKRSGTNEIDAINNIFLTKFLLTD